LYFTSKNQQQQHPEARLIPYPIWLSFGFNASDTSVAFSFMSKPIEALLQGLEKPNTTSEAKRYFLAIAYSHSGLTNDELVQISVLLKMSPSDLFDCAIAFGKLELIESLLKMDEHKEPLLANAFRRAAGYGYVHVLDYLLTLTQKSPLEVIEINNYEIFLQAAKNGDLRVITYLIATIPQDDVLKMLAAENYHAFYSAAQQDHVEVVKYLLEQLPKQDLATMIAVHGVFIFCWADLGNYESIIKDLLHFSVVFAHAEYHVHEYQQRTGPFITEKLLALQQARVEFETLYPNSIFDVEDADEALLCFYILRHLIRRNDATLLREMHALLNIPSVEAFLHGLATQCHANPLLRLALSIGNEEASRLLLMVPAVRTLAEQNNYYQDEYRNGIDARAIAQDRESSMRALSAAEQKRLQRATDHYDVQLKELTVPVIMDNLRDTLCARYKAKPAQIVSDAGITIVLPMSWKDFEALNLCQEGGDGEPTEHQRALEAYYQHKDHTAFRYLLKPNPWIHSEALYVKVNDLGTERWAYFDGYEPLIAMLFLAASDEHIEPCDGFTLEARLEHFIDELAHIGRAHNWDVFIEEGVPGKESLGEQDDLDADRPSCYSGVKKRLFQSVLGHPLLTLLTVDIVKQKLNELVREHFKAAITDDNRDKYKKAWDDSLNDDLEFDARQAAMACLKELDINSEQKKMLLETLVGDLDKKYGGQFSNDAILCASAEAYLELDEKDKSATHATQFAYITWYNCLEVKVAHNYIRVSSPSSMGLFSSSRPEPMDHDLPVEEDDGLTLRKNFCFSE